MSICFILLDSRLLLLLQQVLQLLLLKALSLVLELELQLVEYLLELLGCVDCMYHYLLVF